jgi:hypothetical protein
MSQARQQNRAHRAPEIAAPGNRLPPADRLPAMDERDGLDPSVGKQHSLWYHRNTVARCCQRNERLRGSTFEDDVRSNTRRLAGRVEPFPGGKSSSEQQKPLAGKVHDIEYRTALQSMARSHDRQQIGKSGRLSKRSSASGMVARCTSPRSSRIGSRTPPSSVSRISTAGWRLR